MSNSTLPSPPPMPGGPPQSLANVIGPGIAGLFIQGLETGLVVTQFCRWFSSERNEGVALFILITFVTVVGLAQSGLAFASVWQTYVQKFGEPVRATSPFKPLSVTSKISPVVQIVPDPTDFIQFILTPFVAVPVQALMLRRCYYIVGKNMYIITPLVALLIISIAMFAWLFIHILQFEITGFTCNYLRMLDSVGVPLPYFLNLILPSILDVAISGILLHYLTRSMRQVYTAYIRRRLAHLMTVVWQSAIPPTLCTIFLSVVCIQFFSARQDLASYIQKKSQLWFLVVQEMMGKLYVLSLFYIINDRPLTNEQPTTFAPTLTVPIDANDTYSLDTRISGEAACSQSAAARLSAMSADNAV
ncbi:hypothetical protein BJV74DRAFT_882644 [Russula compacta]|nr:hypothetical protein BJV74DRAFT_882644 [Russula compacta]